MVEVGIWFPARLWAPYFGCVVVQLRTRVTHHYHAGKTERITVGLDLDPFRRNKESQILTLCDYWHWVLKLSFSLCVYVI